MEAGHTGLSIFSCRQDAICLLPGGDKSRLEAMGSSSPNFLVTCTVKASETNLYILDRISIGRSRNLSVEGDMMVRRFSFSFFSLGVGMIDNSVRQDHAFCGRGSSIGVPVDLYTSGFQPLASPLHQTRQELAPSPTMLPMTRGSWATRSNVLILQFIAMQEGLLHI